MKKYQWIIYDQCNIRYIEPGVTDIVFLLYTGTTVASPIWPLKFNIRSNIMEYAIAKAFLAECETLGYTTHWIETNSYRQSLIDFSELHQLSSIVLMRPSEEYLARKIASYILPHTTLDILPNRQFLITPTEFAEQFEKPPVMETFYRYMRKTRNILMEEGKPLWGKWNYDQENRNFDSQHVPSWDWKSESSSALDAAKKYFRAEDIEVYLPVTRADALQLLEYFLEHHAHDFGYLEDAMYQKDRYVHHSLISTALNFWLLYPEEILEKVTSINIPLASQEGFIRQILGWREYMRQYHLYYFDTIYSENALGHMESLPEAWWSYDGKTHNKNITTLNCVDTVIAGVQELNYSHHIERLMIIGNYSMLMGYHPHSVLRWFYEMYTDAFEWVVVPNVLSMSQYVDGGKLATKPYISWGNYIDKMSDYCKGCQYSIKEKTCPMTHLYWDFVDRHQDLYAGWRTPYILSNLKKIDIEKIRLMKAQYRERLKTHIGKI